MVTSVRLEILHGVFFCPFTYRIQPATLQMVTPLAFMLGMAHYLMYI